MKKERKNRVGVTRQKTNNSKEIQRVDGGGGGLGT